MTNKTFLDGVTAKCVENSDALKVGEFYKVKFVAQGAYGTHVALFDANGLHNSILFEFYKNDKRFDLESEYARNAYLKI